MLASRQVLKLVLDELWKSQGQQGTKRWYGIRLTFTPAGESELALDYDPECGEDPTYSDDRMPDA